MGISLEEKRHVGRVVTNRRAALGLSMRDLEEMCGVSPSTIHRIEKGRLGRLDNVQAVMDALGLNLHKVIRGGKRGIQLELEGSAIN